MSTGSARGRGVNWLFLWLALAIVVGAALVVAVTVVPGAHASSEPSPATASNAPGPALTSQVSGRQTVTVSGLALRLPADAQVERQPSCFPANPYNGTGSAYVLVWQMDWNQPSACPAEPANPSPRPTPPSTVPTIALIPYKTDTSFDDLARAGTIVATATDAGQTVDIETGQGDIAGHTLLVFTKSHVGIDLGAVSPAAPLVAQLLADASAVA